SSSSEYTMLNSSTDSSGDLGTADLTTTRLVSKASAISRNPLKSIAFFMPSWQNDSNMYWRIGVGDRYFLNRYVLHSSTLRPAMLHLSTSHTAFHRRPSFESSSSHSFFRMRSSNRDQNAP